MAPTQGKHLEVPFGSTTIAEQHGRVGGAPTTDLTRTPGGGVGSSVMGKWRTHPPTLRQMVPPPGVLGDHVPVCPRRIRSACVVV